MLADGTVIGPETEALWLEERRNSVGASEAAAALGVCPFKSPVELWQEKTGRAAPFAGNEATYFGKLLEPVLAAEYTRRTGREVVGTQVFRRHPEYPHLTATVDGVVGDGRLLELKTAGAWAKGWGEEGSDALPEPYLVQVHQQMAVCGAARADVAVLIGGQAFRVYEVVRDEALVDAVVTGVSAFWVRVKAGTPPDWGRMDPRALAALFPGCEGEVALDGDDAAAADGFDSLTAKLRALESLRDAYRDRVLAAMGGAMFGRLPDGRMVRRYVRRSEACVKQVQYKACESSYFRVLPAAKVFKGG